jgi:phage portal protein BeeE
MKLFGFEISRATQAWQRKSVPPTVWSWMRADDLERSGPYLSNAYQQVVWVYRAINVLAEQVANVPFLFSSGTRGRENLITAGPLIDFYLRPHPQLNRFQYWELRVIWLMLRGECFRIPIFDESRTETKPGATGRRLKAVVMLDPAHFHHIVADHQLIGWRYTGLGPQAPLESQVFLPEEVWFERLPNPFDFWRGLPPLSAAAMAAATDFAAGAFMRGIIENNADTGVIVRADKPLAPEQQEQLFAALRDRKRRAGRADQPLLVTGCAEVIKPQLSSSDLQFLENRKFSRAEICAAFGVPEEIVTATDHAKYDVMQGARLNFIENRVAPLCGRLEAEELKTVTAIDRGAVGWFDLDSLPLMQQARRERLATARAGFEMGVPFNELNRVLDLGFKALPWGDLGYVPARFQLVSAEPSSAPAKEAAKTQPTANPFERMLRTLESVAEQETVPRRCALPDLESRAKLKAGRLQRFFFEQRGRFLQAVCDWDRAGRPGPPSARLPAAEVEHQQLVAALRPGLKEDAELAAAAARPDLRPDVAEGSALVEQLLARQDARLRALNESRRQAIEQTLALGLAQRETGEQLACRIRTVYNLQAQDALHQVALGLTIAAFEAGTQAALNQGGARDVPARSTSVGSIVPGVASGNGNALEPAAGRDVPRSGKPTP